MHHKSSPNAPIAQKTSVVTLGPFIVILKYVELVKAKNCPLSYLLFDRLNSSYGPWHRGKAKGKQTWIYFCFSVKT